MSLFFEQFLARPTALPTSVANLRAEPSAKYVAGLPALIPIAGIAVAFSWNAASLAADNGTTVIKPTDVPALNPGRFLIVPVTETIPPPRQTFFVDGGYTGAITDGGIATPFPTIQAAITAIPAPTADGQVWVVQIAPGFYPENLTVPANRFLILQAATDVDNAQSVAVVLGPNAVGPFNNVLWDVSGSTVNRAGLAILGILINDLTIDATLPHGSPALSIRGGYVAGTTTVSAGTWTSQTFWSHCFVVGAVVLPNAVSAAEKAVFAGAVTVSTMLDLGSTFAGPLTVLGVSAGSAVGTFGGSNITGPISNPNGPLLLDDLAMRLAGRNGALVTAPANPGLTLDNVFRGGAGYYQAQHAVRVSAVDTVLNLGDSYVAMTPPNATTRLVTLPSGRMFGAGNDVPDTVSGVPRAPARQLLIRNSAPSGGTGIVAIAPVIPAERVNGANLAFLRPGESLLLVPFFDPALGNYNWVPLNNYGRDYQSETSPGVSSSVAAVYATKVSLVTLPLTGIYRVIWRAICSASAITTDVQSRLFNATDAVQIGSMCYTDVNAVACRVYHGGGGLVTFAGVAKTFNLDWQRPVGIGSANIEDAWIELWKVG